jgi:hypothetical protein
LRRHSDHSITRCSLGIFLHTSHHSNRLTSGTVNGIISSALSFFSRPAFF